MSGFTKVMLTPRISRTLIMRALQYYFTGHPEYPWVADRAKTQIFIQDEIAEDSKHDSILPTIVVENTGYVFQEDAIGANIADVKRVSEYQHKTEHQYAINGGLNIHCLSQSSIDAEELAFEICFFILSLRNTMHTMFNLQRIGAPSQSKASNIEKEGWNYHYDSVVSVPYVMAIRSIHDPVDPGPPLREILAEISVPGTKPVSERPQIPTPGDDEIDDGWVTQGIIISEPQ